MPAGETRPGDGKRMLIHDEWTDKTIVGRVVLQGGTGAVLELPSGRLQYARTRDLSLTDRPFKADDKKALGRLLVKKFFPKFKVKTSKHYVFVYNSTENFQTGTEAILESMLTGVISRFNKLGFDVHEPDVPLMVVMFRTEAEYLKYFKPTTGWAAFYNHNVNFIAMFEQRTARAEERASARKRAISTIAHEGAHQLLANIGLHQRLSRWPLWTSEGIADYLAPTEVGTKLKWAGPGQINEGRLYDIVEQLNARAGKPIDGNMLRTLITSAQLDSSGYAQAWGLTYFLSQKYTKQYLAYLREMGQIEPNGGVPRGATSPVEANLVVFRKHFGDNLVKLEQEWFEYIGALLRKYETEHVYYVTFMLTVDGRKITRRTGISTSADAARLWQSEQLAELPAQLRRTTRIQTKPIRGRANAAAVSQSWVQG